MYPEVSVTISQDRVIPKDMHAFYFTLVKKTLSYKAVLDGEIICHETKLTSKGGWGCRMLATVGVGEGGRGGQAASLSQPFCISGHLGQEGRALRWKEQQTGHEKTGLLLQRGCKLTVTVGKLSHFLG